MKHAGDGLGGSRCGAYMPDLAGAGETVTCEVCVGAVGLMTPGRIEVRTPQPVRPIVVLDVDALVDGGMTDEERVKTTSLACQQMMAAGYLPVLARAGARVEVLGPALPPMYQVNGSGSAPSPVVLAEYGALLRDNIDRLEKAGYVVVEYNPGHRAPERL